MKLFIDGEWDGYKGELLSLALVSEEGHEYYFIREIEATDSWVKRNVIPIINDHTGSTGQFETGISGKHFNVKGNIEDASKALEVFLSSFREIELIADWPEDIGHFCNLIITGPGKRIKLPNITMQVDFNLEGKSEIPHNALEDARGIRDEYFERYT